MSSYKKLLALSNISGEDITGLTVVPFGTAVFVHGTDADVSGGSTIAGIVERPMKLEYDSVGIFSDLNNRINISAGTGTYMFLVEGFGITVNAGYARASLYDTVTNNYQSALRSAAATVSAAAVTQESSFFGPLS